MDATETVVIRISGSPGPDDVPRLCAELSVLLGGTEGPGEAVCDVGDMIAADLTAVDAIARLRLTAQRLGRDFRLRGAGPELRALLHLVGLSGLAGPG
ncbi:STAS domain-containing protein [Streptomyces sp. NPDC051018]|uniref:STAS domain-containing protein n=1 Tax=Streptomyces sp. NPDC051018 TaxID=3365639 RepID=UPI0037988D97